MTSSLKALYLGSLVLLTACGPAADMPNFDDSSLQLMDSTTNTRFDALPLEGELELGEKFWSGDHWPINKGSINRRWRIPGTNAFEFHSPTQEELSFMNEDEIAKLSPSEKYDLLMGRYDYPLKQEVREKSNPVALGWEGLGDGWAAATVNHVEPKPVALTNPDGLVINFGSADIKALLSYYYSIKSPASVSQMGIRCDYPNSTADTHNECVNDLDAGSFHIVLANKLGVRKESLILDVDRYNEVWNHPVISFLTTVQRDGAPTEGAPAGTARTVSLRTKVTYIDRPYNNTWEPVKETWNQVTTNRVYSYKLHLDGDGGIIKGEWVSYDRPDFIWMARGATNFDGMPGLGQLLQ